MRNKLFAIAISLLLAIVVLWIVWAMQVHTEQSQSEENFILLESLISAIITFFVVYTLLRKLKL